MPSARAASPSDLSPASGSSQSGIPIAIDVNLTEIMRREGIAKIEDYVVRFSVILKDGRMGIAETVGQALAKARKPDAENVRKIAA
jgi:deoxyxylulose-5-phosphate synthase